MVTADVAVAATVAVVRAAVWEEGVAWAAAAVGHQGGAASSVGRVAAAQSSLHAPRLRPVRPLRPRRRLSLPPPPLSRRRLHLLRRPLALRPPLRHPHRHPGLQMVHRHHRRHHHHRHHHHHHLRRHRSLHHRRRPRHLPRLLHPRGRRSPLQPLRHTPLTRIVPRAAAPTCAASSPLRAATRLSGPHGPKGLRLQTRERALLSRARRKA